MHLTRRKLTDDQVRAIRAWEPSTCACCGRPASANAVARFYGIKLGSFKAVRAGLTYKEVR